MSTHAVGADAVTKSVLALAYARDYLAPEGYVRAVAPDPPSRKDVVAGGLDAVRSRVRVAPSFALTRSFSSSPPRLLPAGDLRPA